MLLPVAGHCGECRAGPRAVHEAGEAFGPCTPWSNARTSSRLQGQNARYDDRCRHLRGHAHAARARSEILECVARFARFSHM